MTFTVVARCPRTGRLGVAAATAMPAVGALLPFVRPGVGAAASQSFNNWYLGEAILDALAGGAGAEAAIARAITGDKRRETRQLAAVDAGGRAAAFTGADCVRQAAHLLGDGIAIAGNMLDGTESLAAMAARFAETADLPLEERLLAALEAGQAAGGDHRGRQSACLRVHGTEAFADCDLRVDEHQAPVAELRRVFEVAKVQLFPYVACLPTRDDPGRGLTDAVLDLVSRAPHER